MSREGSREHAAGETAEALEVIREECSPAISSVNMNKPKIVEDLEKECCTHCTCPEYTYKISTDLKPEEVEKLLIAKEEELEVEFKKRLENEIEVLKERANFILQNEQIRSSYMLREAHRERQEKITALQNQLECKNLAALMFVLCAERRKSKHEKLRIIEEYSNYIRTLQEILTEAQTLILNLSRGYKTAGRVDHEWRQKMRKTLAEFQMFIHDFVKGTPETEQFFFDIPELLKTETSIEIDPNEDPCDPDEKLLEHQEKDMEPEKNWFERLEDDDRPFITYGDLGDFKPDTRREILKAQRKVKLAPLKWKEYMFNSMFVNAECNNANVIKDEYPNRVPPPARWECDAHVADLRNQSKQSFSRRTTNASIDARGNMGSILKMITSSSGPTKAKATILGARDSMEIASTTKVREKLKNADHTKVVLNIGSRRTSLFTEDRLQDEEDDQKPVERISVTRKAVDDDEHDDDSPSALESLHNDSLTVIPSHVPDQDHKIRFEKICPIEKCQRLEVDSFIRSLPSYMRASPFTHFEQTFEDYETCTPEQLEILKQRIENKKRKEKSTVEMKLDTPGREWSVSEEGVALQTSNKSLGYLDLPPCTCKQPNPTPVDSNGQIYDLKNLIPTKKNLDTIKKERFFDYDIEFDRFKVIGLESTDTIKEEQDYHRSHRLQEIKKVLKVHPSLLDIFQANTA